VITVKYVLGVVLGGIAAAVAANLPDIRRYMRMRAM
jgi:uncharacterized protein DUF6893